MSGVPELIDEVAMENRDTALRRVITHGAAFGIPSVWIFAFVVAIVAGAPAATAAWVAVLPAIVGGPYFGGLAVLVHLQLAGDTPKTAARHFFRHHRPAGMKPA